MDIKNFIKIIEDNDVYIYPDANKSRIDRSVIPHFVPRLKEYKMGQIIYGSEYPDIYTTLYLEGTVMLKHTDNRFDDTFETGKFENFPLFKKGKPVNINIYIKANDNVIQIFKDGGICTWQKTENNIFPLDLTAITFDSYKSGSYEAYVLCGLLHEEMMTKARLKVFKHYRDELSPFIQDKNKELREKYDIDFIRILNENYITDKGYNQISKSKKKRPEYEIKIKGFAHLPKVDDVVERIKDEKPQTTAGKIMVQSIMTCENTDIGLKELDNLIQMNNNDLDFWSQKIRAFKYGMYLEGKWFKEFTEKGNQELKEKDWEFKIVYNGS